MSGMQAMNYAIDHGYTVEEVDAITGPLIGRPKTATFNLNDLVGFDVAVHVARNLYPAIPNDPAREVLNHPEARRVSDELLNRGWLGRKSGQGFFKMVRKGAEKEFWALNLNTIEYEAPKAIEFESVKKHGRVKPLGERIRLLIQEPDRAGQFLWHMHAFYLAYASNRVPEITDTIVNVDNAQKWGFNHEMGPFEIWDAIGVADTIPAFEAAGYPVADWVKQMVAGGKATFYQRSESGKVTGYYSPQVGDYVPYQPDPRAIKISDLRAEGRTVIENEAGAVYDLGDGVLLWEFRTKQNTITGRFIDLGFEALALLEKPEWAALVVSNDAERFSIGANLADAMGGGPEGIEQMIRRLQHLTASMRYAPKPVVTAPFNMTLGGGLEMTMGGTASVAHAELYAGLVEVGVGVVPAGGGCAELVRRGVNPVAERGADVLEPLLKIFTTIATAKVSESAKEARELGFLQAGDRIVMNRAHLTYEAKQFALGLSKTYQPRKPEKLFAAGRDAYAALLVGLAGFVEAGHATEYDAVIARELANILTGGGVSQPGWVDYTVFHELECQAFLKLMMKEKTQERVMYMLANNKPLRN
jgi:3-hydroxyacyl-CoA dehydrogenase